MAHTIRISQFQRPVNAQILIRILPVHNKCMFAVWSNNVDARIIAYSIIQWQLAAVPIQKCQ